MMTRAKIRKGAPKDTAVLADIIRSSFRGVAKRFGLTQENCPKHPSNCTVDWVQRDMDRGVTYFILEDGGQLSGSVALEQSSRELCYLERLAVRPPQQQRGFGKALVDHVLVEAKRLGAQRVGIGIIAGQIELKNWYTKMGFVETETRIFAHLPFPVTFMSYVIDSNYQCTASVNE
jgi:GNAT superfamily N-acetyltransferase